MSTVQASSRGAAEAASGSRRSPSWLDRSVSEAVARDAYPNRVDPAQAHADDQCERFRLVQMARARAAVHPQQDDVEQGSGAATVEQLAGMELGVCGEEEGNEDELSNSMRMMLLDDQLRSMTLGQANGMAAETETEELTYGAAPAWALVMPRGAVGSACALASTPITLAALPSSGLSTINAALTVHGGAQALALPMQGPVSTAGSVLALKAGATAARAALLLDVGMVHEAGNAVFGSGSIIAGPQDLPELLAAPERAPGLALPVHVQGGASASAAAAVPPAPPAARFKRKAGAPTESSDEDEGDQGSGAAARTSSVQRRRRLARRARR